MGHPWSVFFYFIYSLLIKKNLTQQKIKKKNVFGQVSIKKKTCGEVYSNKTKSEHMDDMYNLRTTFSQTMLLDSPYSNTIFSLLNNKVNIFPF